MMKEDEGCCANEKPCCEHETKGGGEASTAGEAEKKFGEFMKSAGKPGALDAATKQAVNIALAVLAKCKPCLETHIEKARQMGFSQEEIDEAAWMAVSFGGCPTMMFYNEVKREMTKRR